MFGGWPREYSRGHEREKKSFILGRIEPSTLGLVETSGWSVTRKTEKPTENSKTRTEPKPKITDFSKTEPNRNRIQKPRLTEKGHF